jgi:hypothetical protein
LNRLPADARDRLYAALAEAISQAGEARESLFLARLSLLLFETTGDEERCRKALADALHDLPMPSLSLAASSAQAQPDGMSSSHSPAGPVRPK